jgi:Transglutaminase-like superfamily
MMRLMPRRVDLPTLRAAWWTVRALRQTKRDLRQRPLQEVVVPPPPELAASARRGVAAVLRRQSPTCLERALVLQRWLAAHGEAPDVVIGVTGMEGGFSAHAWLEGESPGAFHELTRVPARGHG